MKSLDKIVGIEMPICCVWAKEISANDIGAGDIKNNNLVDASKETLFSKVFSKESPYFKEKEIFINSVHSSMRMT
jgi:hypothetical protein